MNLGEELLGIHKSIKDLYETINEILTNQKGILDDICLLMENQIEIMKKTKLVELGENDFNDEIKGDGS